MLLLEQAERTECQGFIYFLLLFARIIARSYVTKMFNLPRGIKRIHPFVENQKNDYQYITIVSVVAHRTHTGEDQGAEGAFLLR